MLDVHNKKHRALRNKEIDDKVIVRLYKDNGLSVYSIAKLTGFNYMTIRYRLKRLGVYEVGGHKIDTNPKIIYDKHGNISGIQLDNGNILPVVGGGNVV